MELVHVFDTAASDYGTVPTDAQAVAPYVDGRYANVGAARARFPHLFDQGMVLTLTALGGDADGIDWEPGDAQPDPLAWFAQQHRRGRWRPCFYADLSDTIAHVLPRLESAHLVPTPGPDRPVRIFTAHPTGTPHICGPHTCGALSVDADLTQYWWTSIQGRFPGAGDVDVSLARLDALHPTGKPPTHRRNHNMIAAAYNPDEKGTEVFVQNGQTGEVFRRKVQSPHTWETLGIPGGAKSDPTPPAAPAAPTPQPAPAAPAA